MYDAIIVGAGPAGLSAALILGRCRRRVLLCDAGHPRNAASRELHGFLTRDGISPPELLRLGREQLARYETIDFLHAEVVEASRREGAFDIRLADGTDYTSRMLLLATGVVDELPDIPGLESLYGHSVFHCPYCDGWEVRDQPLAMYKPGGSGIQSVLNLTVWSRDIILCTDGPATLSPEEREQLACHSIPVCEARITELQGTDGQLEQIVFDDGSRLPRRAMFLRSKFRQRCDLPARLGCEFTEEDVVDSGRKQTTNIPGLFVAGDASREAQLAIVAAAEGAKAAFAINAALTQADTEAIANGSSARQ